ncbi:MAG: septum site-determining protein MinC [Pseudomonadota bacterium]
MRTYPFQVRGTLQTVLVLRITNIDDPEFVPLLVDKIAHSPDFFRDAPLVIDVGAIASTEPIDLRKFAVELRRHRLCPIGIQHGTPEWNEEALNSDLAVFGAGGTPQQEERPLSAAAKKAPAAKRGAAKFITEPIRGGQQIIVHDGDLVVLSTVGHGAELAATGHIHIYGHLRGRAFAGIDGDESAMIFCDRMDAQLVSVAGIHLVNEEIDPKLMSKRVRVSCDGERLHLHAVE